MQPKEASVLCRLLLEQHDFIARVLEQLAVLLLLLAQLVVDAGELADNVDERIGLGRGGLLLLRVEAQAIELPLKGTVAGSQLLCSGNLALELLLGRQKLFVLGGQRTKLFPQVGKQFGGRALLATRIGDLLFELLYLPRKELVRLLALCRALARLQEVCAQPLDLNVPLAKVALETLPFSLGVGSNRIRRNKALQKTHKYLR